jgi:flagellar motor switch protein FliM
VDHAWISRFKERLMEVPVDVNVTFGQTQITGRQLLNLEEGDILMLDTDEEDPMEAYVQGVPKFYGYPGEAKGNKAFQVLKDRETNY